MKKFYVTILIISGLCNLQAQICGIEGQQLNKAVIDGRVDSTWKGHDLPQGFSGKDVIIGFTDWGFDYTHPVFYDTLKSHYRVLRAWDQFRNEGPAPQGFNYGTEIIGQAELLQKQCDTFNVYRYGYHGTHVAGIAGGAGAGTQYRGVAYDANLLFATFLVSEQAVMDAFHWMYNVAQQEQKRLIINMSWGLYYMGCLDGSGAIAEVMQELSDLGVVFVTSAGNNGDENFHLGHAFTNETPDTLKSQIKFSFENENYWGQSISMTNSPNTPFSFSLKVMDNSLVSITSTPFYYTNQGDRDLDTFLIINQDTIIYNVNIKESNSYNGRPEVRLRLKKPVGNKYTFALFVTAESGDFHAWNLAELTNDVGNWGGDFYAPTLFPEWANGDPQYGIGTPANVDCAISIAAHHSRYQTPSGNWTGGQIANFSSYGPTIDGRQKPEISAPGNNVISALSSYTTTYSGMFSKTVTFNDRSYRFVPLSGTSMSSPFVAGVVALILQANPYLSSAQVKEILITTAYQDSFTEQVGPERFGYGKINAHQAVFKALHTVGVEDHSIAESKYTLFPIPAQHILYVTIESNDPHITSEIFDISGKLVTKQNLKPGVNQINIQTYPTGCYFIKITDKKNVTMKKLIKN